MKSQLEPALAGEGRDTGVLLADVNADDIAWSTLVPRTAGGPAGWQAVVKRTIDIVVSLVGLLLISPALVVAAVGVKLSSEGPILFRQTRVGRHGQPFTMLKFRTFPTDHVDVTQSLAVEACPLRWGRALRRTSIDELPQLLNVLKGDMSIVGPRPERPKFSAANALDIVDYRERFRVPAGITGLAQVQGYCGDTSIQDRVDADNAYIEGWTIWRDLAIIARTIPTLARKIFW